MSKYILVKVDIDGREKWKLESAELSEIEERIAEIKRRTEDEKKPSLEEHLSRFADDKARKVCLNVIEKIKGIAPAGDTMQVYGRKYEIAIRGKKGVIAQINTHKHHFRLSSYFGGKWTVRRIEKDDDFTDDMLKEIKKAYAEYY